ncbi:glutathione synthase [Amphibiibacter pelophylacis]|uniref:Glutathione synthase n=1 Tax=Amphibiibacter pelophylacis TaxID=1799477 RepID=A0ACC6P4U7_9BURK
MTDSAARTPASILFVADAPESFAIYKDSTYVMMREAQRRGLRVWVALVDSLTRTEQTGVQAQVRELLLHDLPLPVAAGTHPEWFDVAAGGDAPLWQPLKDFAAVLMRKDPPFDTAFFYATHLLAQAAREGARVFNRPEALFGHPEKLSILEFPQFTPPTLVTRDATQIRAFWREHGDIILKPLDGMGGAGIFRVAQDGMNLGSIIEMLSQDGAQTIMVQRRLPEIDQGDKRVLLIGGEPVPYALARIPQNGEVRGNLAAGGRGEARPLTDDDWRIARALGPVLAGRGLFLVGLDIIGSHLTEINVTSPTCFQEITWQTGCDVARLFWDGLAKQGVGG